MDDTKTATDNNEDDVSGPRGQLCGAIRDVRGQLKTVQQRQQGYFDGVVEICRYDYGVLVSCSILNSQQVF